MSYQGLHGALGQAEDGHLGGNVRGGDPHTFCPKAWSYLIDRFAPDSMMDLGCGQGYAARYFHARGIKAVAIDGFDYNLTAPVYPVVIQDLTKGPVQTKVDLVHCQEVVEHIEETYLDNLLRSLMCGRFIVITHAVPGQFGHHHVNCQPEEYWVNHLSARGCTFLREDSDRVRALAAQDEAPYLAATGLVFGNLARI